MLALREPTKASAAFPQRRFPIYEARVQPHLHFATASANSDYDYYDYYDYDTNRDSHPAHPAPSKRRDMT